MHKFRPMIVIGTSILVVLAALFVLPRRPAGRLSGDVIIISIQNEGGQREFKHTFEAWHLAKYGRRCEVTWLDAGGTSAALRMVKSQFAATPGGIGVDLMWGGGVEPYLQLAGLGLLAPVKLPDSVLAAVPASVGGMPLHGPKFEWYGTALSGFGILWNRPRIAKLGLLEPKTWEDLAAPGFFGEVGAADPRASGTAQMMVEVILEAYGWEKGWQVLTRIGGNVKSFSRAASDTPRLVSLGDTAAALAIDFYAWKQIQQDGKEKIGFVLPKGLTAITPDAIGELKGAPHPENARRFIEFLLSPEAQRLWVLPKGAPGGPEKYELLRIPVLPQVYKQYAGVTSVLFDPSGAEAGFRHDPARAAVRRDALKDLYGAVIVDLQPELAEAWKAVIRRGLKPDEIKELCTPPVTEQELDRLARKEWSDQQIRNRTITEWSNQARERYHALARKSD